MQAQQKGAHTKWMVELPDIVCGLVGIGAYASMVSEGGHLLSSLHPACIQVWSPRMLRVGKVGLKVGLKWLSVLDSYYRT